MKEFLKDFIKEMGPSIFPAILVGIILFFGVKGCAHGEDWFSHTSQHLFDPLDKDPKWAHVAGSALAGGAWDLGTGDPIFSGVMGLSPGILKEISDWSGGEPFWWGIADITFLDAPGSFLGAYGMNLALGDRKFLLTCSRSF